MVVGLAGLGIGSLSAPARAATWRWRRARSGVLVEAALPDGPSMFFGRSVYVEGNGEGARVVPHQ